MHELSKMTWTEVEEYLSKDNRLILPVGSCEQHGPTGVFSTDILIPEAIAREAARITGILTAPPLNYGMSLHHMAFPGSASFTPITYIGIIKELLLSFISHGFSRILVLNGHGSNSPSLQCAVTEVLNSSSNFDPLVATWWGFPEVVEYEHELFGRENIGFHATPTELSLVLHIFPELERKTSIPPQQSVTSLGILPLRQRFKEKYPLGIIGARPELADPELGRKLFDKCVDVIVRVINKWSTE